MNSVNGNQVPQSNSGNGDHQTFCANAGKVCAKSVLYLNGAFRSVFDKLENQYQFVAKKIVNNPTVSRVQAFAQDKVFTPASSACSYVRKQADGLASKIDFRGVRSSLEKAMALFHKHVWTPINQKVVEPSLQQGQKVVNAASAKLQPSVDAAKKLFASVEPKIQSAVKPLNAWVWTPASEGVREFRFGFNQEFTAPSKG